MLAPKRQKYRKQFRGVMKGVSDAGSRLEFGEFGLKAIELSEKTNRVIKRNAGKDNENVKHDPSLVREITKGLFPSFASALELVHNNSVI